ncbi:hypothetical protein H6G89_02340 [Oscillatoria sp. FACHB-1407]|uniref:hypothetical protein n=1 Tax=Oscillatoria sp. FACHB-1407 TaxID=2692847 RepID=UPI001686BA40|nr:hypothetical protein [Oscillatoria sp. FACHB-1407]MBD2459873.1 hypothetical protein [Oscillatoria sp. FACHB-1407]
MKPNVVNILKVCGITLFFLSPALGVLTIVWHYHTALSRTQQAIASGFSTPSDAMLSDSLLISSTPQLESCSTAFYSPGLMPPVITQLQTVIHTLLGIGFLLGLGYAFGNALYKRYRGYRVTVIREQVERLERLWQQEHC